VTIPATVVLAFDVLAAVRDGDPERAALRTTRAGGKRLARILGDAGDPRAAPLRTWDGAAQGRVQGDRALCRFGTLADGRVAVLDLRLGRDGWRVDDVRLLARDDYDDFGVLDEGPSNVLG
jgi:hypothetical protein